MKTIDLGLIHQCPNCKHGLIVPEYNILEIPILTITTKGGKCESRYEIKEGDLERFVLSYKRILNLVCDDLAIKRDSKGRVNLSDIEFPIIGFRKEKGFICPNCNKFIKVQ